MSDKKIADGKRVPFQRQAVTNTQVLLVTPANRWALVLVNEGPNTILMGHSGTPTSHWMGIPNGSSFTDTYTQEDWWVVSSSSSGTISGFSVV